MNSYFTALNAATNNNQRPEFGDLWRNYHETSVLSDSDFQDMTDENDLLSPWGGTE